MNSSPEIVKFNIGGQIFTTTKSTINKHPNSMLSKLISNANNNNNEHFIDRDGTYFSYILTFLRTLNYNHIYEIDDLNILPILIQECDFYCIDDLKTKLQNIVSSPSPSVRDQQVCILTCVSFLKTSKIKRLCANKTYVLDHIFPKEYSSWGFLLELIDDENIVSTKKVAALKPKTTKKKEDDNDYDKKDEEDIKISSAMSRFMNLVNVILKM